VTRTKQGASHQLEDTQTTHNTSNIQQQHSAHAGTTPQYSAHAGLCSWHLPGRQQDTPCRALAHSSRCGSHIKQPSRQQKCRRPDMWANLLRTFQSAPYATGTLQIASQVQDVKPSSCLVVKSTQRAHNHNLPKPKKPRTHAGVCNLHVPGDIVQGTCTQRSMHKPSQATRQRKCWRPVMWADLLRASCRAP
jgi:hypothetical protein